MKLGFFTRPLHPLDKNWQTCLNEDREAIILADKLDPVAHPLVRRHPVTNKPSLFLSPHKMVKIIDYDYDQGRKLLDFLIEHSIQSKYVYKHTWNDNDIVMWDNRCTMHSVEPFNNNTIKRIMHRGTLVGDQEPIMA